MSARRPDARERRTIAVSLAILGLAALAAFVVVPGARRWRDREVAIGAARERVARLQRLSAQGAELAAVADAGAREGTGMLHVLRGRTSALAASDLQGLLQDVARMSRVSVSRLEVSGAADPTQAGQERIVATMSATTDIYGLADLLGRLQGGSVLLAVEEVSVSPNPVLRGNLLQLALTVHAPFIVEP
jgi:hypothetical protein